MAGTIPAVYTAGNGLVAAPKAEPPADGMRQGDQFAALFHAVHGIKRQLALLGELLRRQDVVGVEGRARDDDGCRPSYGGRALRPLAVLARDAHDARMHAGQGIDKCCDILEGERADQRGNRRRFHCRPRYAGTRAIRPRLHAAI